jgi:hypothetical protein
MLEAIGNLAHVYLLLWAGETPDENLVAGANTACELLEKYARVFPIMSPRTNILLGLREWLLERPSSAFAYWQKGLIAAEKYGMPYDQALAHHEIGRRTADPATQQDHFQKARELFNMMGIEFDFRA